MIRPVCRKANKNATRSRTMRVHDGDLWPTYQLVRRAVAGLLGLITQLSLCCSLRTIFPQRERSVFGTLPNPGSREGGKNVACKVRILLIDDESYVLQSFARRLSNQEVRTAISIEEALAHLDAGFEPEVVITDYNLGSGTFGTEVLEIVQSRCPNAIRILISGTPEIIPLNEVTDLAHRVLSKISPLLGDLFTQIQKGDITHLSSNSK